MKIRGEVQKYIFNSNKCELKIYRIFPFDFSGAWSLTVTFSISEQ